MTEHYSNSELTKAQRRMEHLVPAFLGPYLQGRRKVCSVGCGMAFDVQALSKLGYEACGFDPGPRSEVWSQFPDELQDRLKVGFATDYPFGRAAFDAVYSLEVLEHVGCRDGGTRLESDWKEQRLKFIQACLDMTKPGGVVLVASLNRWFPADFKHKHTHSWLHRLTGFLVNPWSPRNFLPTVSDIESYLGKIAQGAKWEVKRLPTGAYPSGAARQRNKWRTRMIRAALRFLDLPGIRVFNPILLVEIRERREV